MKRSVGARLVSMTSGLLLTASSGLVFSVRLTSSTEVDGSEGDEGDEPFSSSKGSVCSNIVRAFDTVKDWREIFTKHAPSHDTIPKAVDINAVTAFHTSRQTIE